MNHQIQKQRFLLQKVNNPQFSKKSLINLIANLYQQIVKKQLIQMKCAINTEEIKDVMDPAT